MSVLFGILISITIYLLGHMTGDYLVMLYLVSKHAKEKHVCNHCEVGFLSRGEELDYIYCPYCGRPLDYHSLDERSESYKGEE